MFFFCLISISILFFPCLSTSPPKVVNVILFIADDLRADVSSISKKYAEFTPNINRLAKKSLVFTNAFSQQALCGPSRNSFLTGRRPDSLDSWNFLTNCRRYSNRLQTLPGAFLAAGYETYSIGKVMHVYSDLGNDPISWTETHLSPGALDEDKNCAQNSLWCTCSSPCSDEQIANKAIEIIQKKNTQKSKGKPFFLGIGFRRPHPDFVLPNNFPSFSSFPMTGAKYSIAPNFTQSIGMPLPAYYSCSGFSTRLQFLSSPLLPWNSCPSSLTIQVRQQYWRSAAYMDKNLGSVLDALESSSFLSSNTIVIFTSDHGFALGERGMFCKQSVFDVTTRVPFMIHVPWLNGGIQTNTIVELLDIFPTLVGLIQNPKFVQNDCGEGKDLSPLFRNVDLYSYSNSDPLGGIDLNQPWFGSKGKSFALSQYPRCLERNLENKWGNPCSYESNTNFGLMGYSIRTNRWRYTEWRKWQGFIADWSASGLDSAELYQHSDSNNVDFEEVENENVLTKNVDIAHKLSLALRKIVIGYWEVASTSCRPDIHRTVSPVQSPSGSPTGTLYPTLSNAPTMVTQQPTTLKPTTTTSPTSPPSKSPTSLPTTKSPISKSPSRLPTRLPSTTSPSKGPSIPQPSSFPISNTPTIFPTVLPTRSPTMLPTSAKPTSISPTTIKPTNLPTTTLNPTSISPTGIPTTLKPTSSSPTTLKPTSSSPTIRSPTPKPASTTKSPSGAPVTRMPTTISPSIKTSNPSLSTTNSPSLSPSIAPNATTSLGKPQFSICPKTDEIEASCSSIDWSCNIPNICETNKEFICPCWVFEAHGNDIQSHLYFIIFILYFVF